MKQSKNKYKYLIINLLIVAFLWFVIKYFEKNSDQAFIFYNKSYHLFYKGALLSLFGLFPFSVGDLIYTGLVIIVIVYLYLFLKKNKIKPLVKVMAIFTTLFGLFYFNWGLNYFTKTEKDFLTNYSGPVPIEDDFLFKFSKAYILKANALNKEMTKNDFRLIDKLTFIENAKEHLLMYRNRLSNYDNFSNDKLSIKNSVFSSFLSYAGYGGYFNPFTFEAQINAQMTSADFINTVHHEMAHQMGYAPEFEANFIGYLGGITSAHLYIKWCAHFNAIKYLLSQIRSDDEAQYRELILLLDKEYIDALKETYSFWNSYNNPLEPYIKKIYDVFLKQNGQKNGIKSYNVFVNYLINYHKDSITL